MQGLVVLAVKLVSCMQSGTRLGLLRSPFLAPIISFPDHPDHYILLANHLHHNPHVTLQFKTYLNKLSFGLNQFACKQLTMLNL